MRRCLFKILLVILAIIGTGCGGFAASRSVSPMDFIMPRVMNQDKSGADRIMPSRSEKVTNDVPVAAPLQF